MTHDRITSSLLSNVHGIVESAGASAVFVYADALDGALLDVPEAIRDKVYYVTRTQSEQQEQEDRGTRTIRVPNIETTRFGQIRMAVFLASANGLVRRGDVIVFLTGGARSRSLDTVLVTEVGKETEILASQSLDLRPPPGTAVHVIERIIDIAAKLGSEGREGKAVGALFVVGDADRVERMSRQLILNPFRGYEPSERNVMDESLEETIKELSTIDGAFVIDGEGHIRTCGAYLKTALQDDENYSLPRGLGARHHAAAGISAVTDAIAITVSESTGTVTVFRSGEIVVEIERSR